MASTVQLQSARGWAQKQHLQHELNTALDVVRVQKGDTWDDVFIWDPKSRKMQQLVAELVINIEAKYVRGAGVPWRGIDAEHAQDKLRRRLKIWLKLAGLLEVVGFFLLAEVLGAFMCFLTALYVAVSIFVERRAVTSHNLSEAPSTTWPYKALTGVALLALFIRTVLAWVQQHPPNSCEPLLPAPFMCLDTKPNCKDGLKFRPDDVPSFDSFPTCGAADQALLYTSFAAWIAWVVWQKRTWLQNSIWEEELGEWQHALNLDVTITSFDPGSLVQGTCGTATQSCAMSWAALQLLKSAVSQAHARKADALRALSTSIHRWRDDPRSRQSPAQTTTVQVSTQTTVAYVGIGAVGGAVFVQNAVRVAEMFGALKDINAANNQKRRLTESTPVESVAGHAIPMTIGMTVDLLTLLAMVALLAFVIARHSART